MTREELLSQAFKDENGTLWIPVDTSNSDLIDLLRSGDHIIYKCKNCGLELKKYYDVRHKESTKESLCQSCRMTKCEDRNASINITHPSQLDNLKYGQKFTYNCIKCGKTCTYDFRPQRKNLYSTMMCGECRVHSSRESKWNYNGDKEITLNIIDYSYCATIFNLDIAETDEFNNIVKALESKDEKPSLIVLDTLTNVKESCSQHCKT